MVFEDLAHLGYKAETKHLQDKHLGCFVRTPFLKVAILILKPERLTLPSVYTCGFRQELKLSDQQLHNGNSSFQFLYDNVCRSTVLERMGEMSNLLILYCGEIPQILIRSWGWLYPQVYA